MFFQKLEILRIDKKWSKIKDIVDAFDFWLATRPKSYKGMLAPEQFASYEDVILEISYKLFEDAEYLGILEKRYIVKCPNCFHILNIYTDKDEVIKYLYEYNELRDECDSCEKHDKATSNDVYIFYNLKEKPDKSNFILKNRQERNISYNYKTLTDEFMENPRENKMRYGDEILSNIMPNDLNEFFAGL